MLKLTIMKNKKKARETHTLIEVVMKFLSEHECTKRSHPSLGWKLLACVPEYEVQKNVPKFRSSYCLNTKTNVKSDTSS